MIKTAGCLLLCPYLLARPDRFAQLEKPDKKFTLSTPDFEPHRLNGCNLNEFGQKLALNYLMINWLYIVYTFEKDSKKVRFNKLIT